MKVSLGRRRLIGIVVALKSTTDVPAQRLRTIDAVIDTEPVLPDNLLKLLHRGARYYLHPLGEVIATALPKLLREGAPAEKAAVRAWQLDASGAAPDLSRAPKQKAIVDLLRQQDFPLTTRQIAALNPSPSATLSTLKKRGVIEQTEVRPSAARPAPPLSQTPVTLNAEQQAALLHLRTLGRQFHVDLLDGVTGSGKTEVYLNHIAPIIEAGRQVLVLIPEISLTPQLRRRFDARFPGRVLSYHSRLNARERLDTWLAAASGEVSIVLGTRSAVFLPLPKLGAIVVDEEHDPSLKQADGFRYHARDLAIFRGQIDNCPVLLGSATPSLETLANVARGRFGCMRLDQRAGDAKPPRLHLVNLRRQPLKGGLSKSLVDKMQQHLDKGHQVLLFLNRRGYAPAMLCFECGQLLDCPRCDAHLTYHANLGSLQCHHCGYISRPPPRCPACGENALQPVGAGTQKIEDVVTECFPDYAAIRIDRDSMSRKGALDRALESIRAGEYRIIIGTQMLAKGHDFPNITLVGMIDVDQGLFSSDYHAGERLVQQVLQVSGRAGRGRHAGEVVIQTQQPEHPLLQSLLHQDYRSISETLLEERRFGNWPPYTHIALLRASAHKRQDAINCLEEIATLLRKIAPLGLEILGPAPAPLLRRAGRYRFQLLLRSGERAMLHQTLQRVLPTAAKLKSSRKARWSVDIDPVDLG